MPEDNLPANVVISNFLSNTAILVMVIVLVVTGILVISKKIHKESTTLTVLLGILFATSFFFIFKIVGWFLVGPLFPK